MTPMSLKDQVAYLIKEKGGMHPHEIAEYCEGIPYSSVSSAISAAYSEGNFRREKIKGTNSFRYWYEEGAKPEPMQRSVLKPTDSAMKVNNESLKARIAELEAWKAAAIKRYPDLAIAEVVLKAREIVSNRLKQSGDHRGAQDVLNGLRDQTMLVASVVEALEAA